MEGINAKDRLLAIFFKAIKGESLSVKKLALNFGVSKKTISRDISCLKNFLSEYRDLVGNTELEYSYKEKAYRLNVDFFLTNKELFVMAKIVLGSRSLNNIDVTKIISKLKRLTSSSDGKMNCKILLVRDSLFRSCKSLNDQIISGQSYGYGLFYKNKLYKFYSEMQNTISE